MNKEFITDFKVHPYTQPNFFGYGRIEISLVTAGSNIFLWPNPDVAPLMCPALVYVIYLERIALE